MKKRFMIALCCLVLLMQLLPVVPMAETTSTATVDKGTVAQDLYYCRVELAKMPNGQALVAAYDRIVAGINECATEIEIELSEEEFRLVLDATRRDHTEQFWMDSGYSTVASEDDDSFIVTMQPQYTMTGVQLADAKVAFEQATRSILARLTPDMSQYEMEKALHDMLAVQVDYVTGAPNAHNAYGALVENQAVCEGYAESLQYLLQRVGIQSVEVLGSSINPSTQKQENHAWNIVRIDGEYYLIDLTWDDQGKSRFLSYAYFNQTTAVFENDHVQWTVGYENGETSACIIDLPLCNATVENYYIKNNLVVGDYDVQSIGTLLKNNDLAVWLFIDSDVNAFIDWFHNSYEAVAVVAGAKDPWTANIIGIGNEVYLEFSAKCEHKHTQLVEAVSATCEQDGNIAYYVCQNKNCGKWFADAEAQSYIITHDIVNVFSMGHTWVRKEEEAALLEGETYWYTCSACGTLSDTFSFGPEPEETFDFGSILDFLLENPIILGGGGGSVLLIVIIALIRKARG